MPYKCVINTSDYRPRRCSKKNWEPGTINNFMEAINGWTHTEPTLNEVKWRLMMFQGSAPCGLEEYEEYSKWEQQRFNRITYIDKLCGVERSDQICPPGFLQGPGLMVGALIDALERDGSIRVPFSRVYDSRQYDRRMDGCELIITKVD